MINKFDSGNEFIHGMNVLLKYLKNLTYKFNYFSLYIDTDLEIILLDY